MKKKADYAVEPAQVVSAAERCNQRSGCFKVLLICDVRRLGRFQDIDEAAHYEFLCKEAGISVHYCAEEFGIECNVQKSLMEALKRTMAAQFSRELSDRVFEEKHRLAENRLP
jgi:DNA invertase Pin-like site-specific DNA recombinase